MNKPAKPPPHLTEAIPAAFVVPPAAPLSPRQPLQLSFALVHVGEPFVALLGPSAVVSADPEETGSRSFCCWGWGKMSKGKGTERGTARATAPPDSTIRSLAGGLVPVVFALMRFRMIRKLPDHGQIMGGSKGERLLFFIPFVLSTRRGWKPEARTDMRWLSEGRRRAFSGATGKPVPHVGRPDPARRGTAQAQLLFILFVLSTRRS